MQRWIWMSWTKLFFTGKNLQITRDKNQKTGSGGWEEFRNYTWVLLFRAATRTWSSLPNVPVAQRRNRWVPLRLCRRRGRRCPLRKSGRRRSRRRGRVRWREIGARSKPRRGRNWVLRGRWRRWWEGERERRWCGTCTQEAFPGSPWLLGFGRKSERKRRERVVLVLDFHNGKGGGGIGLQFHCAEILWGETEVFVCSWRSESVTVIFYSFYSCACLSNLHSLFFRIY